jgi:hypothetical protein
LDLKQSPVFKLQRITIGHRNRLRKVQKDILALVGNQTDASAMARVKIERDRALSLFLRPISGGSMN